MSPKILVTGAAGFIGFHLCRRLLAAGDQVIGLDNLNEYYDVRLKLDRLERIKDHDHFHFFQIDLSDREAVARLFAEQRFDKVVNLAAQAGVRYSLVNPYAYADTNLMGFLNILKGAGITRSSTWSLPPPVRFMGPTPGCLFPCTTTSITRFLYMPPPKRPTN